MAVDLLNNAENSSLGISPRISFSHDVCQADIAAIDRRRPDSLLLESNDFDFCISSDSFEHDSSSCADELFSNGKILPLEIKKQFLPPKPPTHPENPKKETSKDVIEKNPKDQKQNPSPSPPSSSSSSSSSKSWFKRSSSCGNGYKRSLICNLPLLSRSNSTGSAPNPKRSSSLKESSKNSPLKGTSSSNAYIKSSSSSSSNSSSSSSYPYSYSTSSQKKNSYGGAYNNGIRISPVLNVPPPYISKGTVNLFGLGSFFSNTKDKNKKKKSEFT